MGEQKLRHLAVEFGSFHGKNLSILLFLHDNNILKHRSFLEENNKLNEKRLDRNRIEVKELVQRKISKIVKNLEYTEEVDELLTKTMTKEIDPYSISNILFEKVKESSN